MSEGSEGQGRLVLRGCVFAVLTTFIVVAPGMAEYARGVGPRWLPRWDMFAGSGLKVVELKLETLDDQGRRVPVDRFEVLGHDGRWDAPENVRLVREVRDVRKLAHELCRKMNDRPLFVRVRSATRDGFKIHDEGKRDVCAGPRQGGGRR
jgi:hypothetical protein